MLELKQSSSYLEDSSNHFLERTASSSKRFSASGMQVEGENFILNWMWYGKGFQHLLFILGLPGLAHLGIFLEVPCGPPLPSCLLIVKGPEHPGSSF